MAGQKADWAALYGKDRNFRFSLLFAYRALLALGIGEDEKTTAKLAILMESK